MNKYKNNKDFRILFLYPNIQMSALAPQGIGYLSAVLKSSDYTVDLFDCTFYASDDTSDTNQEKINNLNVRPFNWSDKGIALKSSNMIEDFKIKIDDFMPDIVAVSVVENTWLLASHLINVIKDEIPVVVGGVFSTYAPEIVINHPKVNFLCRGDGENPLLTLVNKLSNNDIESCKKIPNIWSKIDGNIFKNQIGLGIDMDELPFPDWSIFEEQSLYSPMQGRVYKTMGLETQRGCPYTCTFCNSPANNIVYKAETGSTFYRKKSVKRVREELEFMVKNYDPEFIYFVVDTFLAMGNRELEEFTEMYQDFKIPFWMNTRAETVDEWRADQLEKMNCLRMNIGIEHGNYEYRKQILKRDVSNEKMLKSFNACSGRSFVCVANSIIGMPDENRDLIFDTIKFNKSLPDDIEATGAFIFTPYHGTERRDYAIKKGYLEDGTVCTLNVTKGSVLNLPGLKQEEILDLAKVFSFYVKFEEERWPQIEKVETNLRNGEEGLKELKDEYRTRFYTKPPKGLKNAKDLVISAEDYSDLHG